MVVVAGYEGGSNELKSVEEVRLNLNVNDEWYYGEHEEALDGECEAVRVG